MPDKDQFGLGWRPALAADILQNLDKLDFVEVIMDDYFRASPSKMESLKFLSEQITVIYHGVSLGLASSLPVNEQRLGLLKKFVKRARCKHWSEHLAFVRVGGYEIGHLAAPPRTQATIDGALENIRRVVKMTGVVPGLENIATLVDPPCSEMSEPEWVSAIISKSGCPLLLDLHNLYANALNFGHDPEKYLEEFPLEKVTQIHLSGGHFIGDGKKRLLDDHVHDVPNVVYELLEQAAPRLPESVMVIIERDGKYPEFEALLDQLTRARIALKRGRATLRKSA